MNAIVIRKIKVIGYLLSHNYFIVMKGEKTQGTREKNLLMGGFYLMPITQQDSK